MKPNLIVQPEDIIAELSAETKDEVLRELSDKVQERHPGIDAADLFKILQEREKLGSTGIGDGIAIPHGKLRQTNEIICLFGRSIRGIDFNAIDGKESRLFFLLIAPEEAVGIHLKMLARISRLLKDPTVRSRLLQASDANEISTIIRSQDNGF